jgi:hypothetical protein
MTLDLQLTDMNTEVLRRDDGEPPSPEVQSAQALADAKRNDMPTAPPKKRLPGARLNPLGTMDATSFDDYSVGDTSAISSPNSPAEARAHETSEAETENLPTDTLAAAGDEPSEEVVTGELCSVDGLSLVQMSIDRLAVVRGGETVADLRTRVYRDPAKHTGYLQLSMGQLRKSPLWLHVQDRIAPAAKQIAVHQLVVCYGSGVDFKMMAGEASVHHTNLNGMDNRLVNLCILTNETHDAIHRYLDSLGDEGKAAYLVSIPASADGLGDLPEVIKSAVLADEVRYNLQKDTPTLASSSPAETSAAASRASKAPLLSDHGEWEGDGDSDGSSMTDLSLSFSGDRMVVSGSLPRCVEVVGEDGKPQKDRWGRKEYKTEWAPYTLTEDGILVQPGQPIPESLQPYKTCEIHGVDGQARWSLSEMRRFQRGDGPMPNLFDAIAGAIGQVVGFARLIHLWLVAVYAALTYVFPLARRCPFLHVHSPQPGSGKSTLLEVLWRLAFNAHRVGGSTMAVIPRLVDMARCTLLLDEAENLATPKGGTGLIEILNARADAGSSYLVTGGAKSEMKPEYFELFGPTVIANLSGLAPTLRSRSITIEMVALSNEESDKQTVTVAKVANWQRLRGELYLWAKNDWRAVQDTLENDPDVRVGGNRHADLWRLILAVAKHFAGEAEFLALKQEAADTATASRADDVNEAMAFPLYRHVKCQRQSFSVKLGHLVSEAQSLLEADQQKEIHSKKVAGFCRNLQLGIDRSSKDGYTEVLIDNPLRLKRDLEKRYPYLLRT